MNEEVIEGDKTPSTFSLQTPEDQEDKEDIDKNRITDVYDLVGLISKIHTQGINLSRAFKLADLDEKEEKFILKQLLLANHMWNSFPNKEAVKKYYPKEKHNTVEKQIEHWRVKTYNTMVMEAILRVEMSSNRKGQILQAILEMAKRQSKEEEKAKLAEGNPLMNALMGKQA